MRNTGVFPNMVVQMTSIGEESGALDAMLDKAALPLKESGCCGGWYDRFDRAFDDGLLGVVVGGMIIAMYLPIFEMGNCDSIMSIFDYL